jgi:hypothetical protein
MKRFSTFPWWFKIIAYLLSALLAAVSIFFILVEGISFGNEKVQKWITSFLTSVLSSILLTQPIQVALTSFFFVSVFRKSTDLFKDKSEKKHIQEVKNVSERINENSRIENFRSLNNAQPATSVELRDVRLERLKQRKLKQVLKRIVLNSVFLFVLYATAMSNRDLNSYRYQDSLARNIANSQSQANSIQQVSF